MCCTAVTPSPVPTDYQHSYRSRFNFGMISPNDLTLVSSFFLQFKNTLQHWVGIVSVACCGNIVAEFMIKTEQTDQ